MASKNFIHCCRQIIPVDDGVLPLVKDKLAGIVVCGMVGWLILILIIGITVIL
jgi:preprotein translocase subunit Sss1